jgi:adenylate cyclase
LEARTVERKLAAIFAADVEGYSRLMGRDEVGTLRTLNQYRAIIDLLIASHRGRIFNTAGDSLVADFASAVDAVECAVAVQEAIAKENADRSAGEQMRFRIGIHVGDIMVQGDNLFGDAVNIAARLEALAEPGGICVSGSVRDHIGTKLPVGFTDLGEQRVKNIAQPIKAYRITGATSPIDTPLVGGSSLALPDKPSIAVLPFQNMSGDPEQEYFADGMVEEIITALSRIRWLFVIARNSSFTYKGRAVDVREVARELGVRYVLEGSVRKAGNRVRITGQLIDTTTGAHIWGDRFDGALDDIFELQDQLASSVIGAIEPKLRQSEIERAARKPTDRLDAYDLYLRALAQFHRYTEECLRQALGLLKRALVLDPSYAAAAALIGWCRTFQRLQGWGPLSDEEVTEGVRLARQAIEVGKDDPDALWMSANAVSFFAGDHETAADAVNRALTLNSNSAHGWLVRAFVSYRQNQADNAIESLQRAMRLSPLDPLGWVFTGGLAAYHVIAGRYEEAIEWADRSLRELPRYESALRNRVVACAHIGRLKEAREGLLQLLELQPGLTIARYDATYRSVFSPQIHEIYVDGLRKAGLPEG